MIRKQGGCRRWDNVFQLVELCLCTPHSNAMLERFFSYLRVVKTDWRNKLSEGNLTDLMRIKVAGPTLDDFEDKGYCSTAVHLWYNAKQRRPNQKKRNKKRHSKIQAKKAEYSANLDSFVMDKDGEEDEDDDREMMQMSSEEGSEEESGSYDDESEIEDDEQED